MSTARLDSKHRVVLDRRIRKISGIKKGEKLAAIPFRRGVILVAPEANSFAESLRGFRYKEAEHEASRYLLHQMKARAHS